jgi:hypothetical protein
MGHGRHGVITMKLRNHLGGVAKRRQQAQSITVTPIGKPRRENMPLVEVKVFEDELTPDQTKELMQWC